MSTSTLYQVVTPSQVVAPFVEQHRAPPQIIPAATSSEPCFRRRLEFGLSLGLSLLGHAAVLACLVWHASPDFNWWIPVQSGRTSIQLDSSMASCDLLAEAEPVDQPSVGARALLTEALIELALPPEPVPEMPPLIEWKIPSPTIPEKSKSSPRPRQNEDDPRRSEQRFKDSSPSAPSTASEESRGAEAEAPAIVANPLPLYPADALSARQTGQLMVWVKIDPDGRVVRAGIYQSSGVASLDAAALRQIRLWRFAPAKSGTSGLRMAAYPVTFKIEL